MHRLRTVTYLDVNAVAGHHAMPAALLFSFQNDSKNLDPFYKMDLDLWDCLGRVKLVL